MALLRLTSGTQIRIVWPYNTDQPLTAVHVSDVHRTGYELLEVRTGNGLKPILRTGYTPVGTVDAVRAEARDVLRRAFGEDGRERLLFSAREDGRVLSIGYFGASACACCVRSRCRRNDTADHREAKQT